MKFNLSKIKFSRFDTKRGLKLPLELDERLAEDIGIMIGDGHIGIHKYKSGIDYQVMCFGNAITDRIFYKDYVKNLKKDLFNLKFKFSEQKKNTCLIKINSKGLVEFYTKVIGLPSGKKENIKIPSIIKKADDKIKRALVRGLADSDFTLSFRKKDKKLMYYPLIKLDTSSKNLIIDLKKILNSLGFKLTVSFNLESIHSKTKKISVGHELSLNGRENLEKWMQIIGFNNPKNILKYTIWKKQGFCPRDEEIRRIMKETGPAGFEPVTF